MATNVLKGVANKLDTLEVDRGLFFSSRKTVSLIFKKRNEEPTEIILRN